MTRGEMSVLNRDDNLLDDDNMDDLFNGVTPRTLLSQNSDVFDASKKNFLSNNTNND
jgi:hypothetical protein